MTNEELRSQLITGLKNTGAEVVHLNAGQVIACLGVAKTEQLATYLVNMQEAPSKKIKPASAIKPEKLTTNIGMAGFKRLELLKELENVKPEPTKDAPSTGQRNTDKTTAVSVRSNSPSPKNPADPAAGS